MDRQFLFSVTAVLTIALALIFIQKKNPDFFPNLVGEKTQESWQKDNTFPKSDSTPEPKVEPKVEDESKAEPTPDEQVEPSQPEQQQHQQHHRRRHLRQERRMNECPPNNTDL